MTPAHAYVYRNLGVTLALNVPLIDLPRQPNARHDVTVEIVWTDACPAVGPQWTEISATGCAAWRAKAPGGSRLRLQYRAGNDEWADFVIAARGDYVRLALSRDADLWEAQQLLLGNVFSCLLAQRGLTCLHASVIAAPGRPAIALVGPKGAGKSTTALACVSRGARLVSDDVAAVAVDTGGAVTAAVGQPQLRLDAESAGAFRAQYETLRPVWLRGEESLRKRYHEVDGGDGRRAVDVVPLGEVFVLAPRGAAKPALRELSAGDLLPKLLAARHMSEVLDRDGHRRDLACLAALVARVNGFELLRPDDLTVARELADIVLAR